MTYLAQSQVVNDNKILINYPASEFQVMVNPQKKPESPEKKSLRSLKKFLPQLKDIAKKEGLSEDNKKGINKEKTKLKVDTIVAVFKDERVKINV